METKSPWWVGTVFALAGVTFAYFVWPTPLRSMATDPTHQVRQHRLTGESQMRWRSGGRWTEWSPVTVFHFPGHGAPP